MKKILRIGTRGSPLALYQAELVGSLLRQHEIDVLTEIVPLVTQGDQLGDQPLSTAGGKGLFCKEVDQALLRGDVDMGVHSCKDMPTALAPGLVIGALLKRADPRDVFVSENASSLEDLREGAIVGTASLRRQAQAYLKRPDLRFVILRGSVEKRLAKCRDGTVDATFLAAAGLRRLGEELSMTQLMSVEEMVPAVGQGCITVTTRCEDQDTRRRVERLHHVPTALAITAERAFLRALDGNCRTPIAGYARWVKGTLRLDGFLMREEDRKAVRGTLYGHNPVALGHRLAWALRRELG